MNILDKNIIKGDNDIRKLEETKRLKSVEDRQVSSEVFDNATLKVLYKLAKLGYINQLSGVISTGKEANVLKGIDDNGNIVAVKIYRVVTSDFKKIRTYIDGDPRFKTHGNNKRQIIREWTYKEFKNLGRLANVGVNVPEVFVARENVLVMEYLYSDENKDKAALPLQKSVLNNAELVFDKIIEFMNLSYNKAGLVHGDLSMYNILMSKKQPYIIDLSQGTLTSHPISRSLLDRDINNIINNAKRFNVNLDFESVKNRVLKT
ncbi:MAG: serine protein kinase RIO [Methanobacteriaceae archaeon]|nr:serine protein kinase RIO [Methanobacteriaceae archaeon]